MHDVPRDFLDQLLEHYLGEFRWKDILDQVRIAFSDFVTYAKCWYRCLRATMCDRLWRAVDVDCGSHVAMVKMTPTYYISRHIAVLSVGIHAVVGFVQQHYLTY
jgi:hypothetical protein